MAKLSIKKQREALDILKDYQGLNPYILRLKKNVYVLKKDIGEINLEFILRNYNKEPKPINKIVRLADWYAKKKQDDWGLDFLPSKIKVTTYLGDTSDFYCAYLQYRKSVNPEIYFFPKKAVLTDFLAEDYTKINVDFERYDRLSKYKRVLFPHQKEAVKFLLARKKCLLADSQGMGKTTSIAVAAIEGNFDAILIICPASLKNNWKKELSFYVPERDITVIDSFNEKTKGELEKFLGYAEGRSNKTRTELLKEAKENGKWNDNRFVILNYDILDEFYHLPKTKKYSEIDAALAKSPLYQYIDGKKSLVIIDEVHNFSDTKSNRYKLVRSILKKGNPHSIYLATGTPLTNSPENLFCVLALLGEPITDDWQYYMKRYCGAEEFCHPADKGKRSQISSNYIKSKGKMNWYELTDDEKKELNDIIKKECRMILVPQPDKVENLEELRDRISHIYLRRTKDDLSLPNKTIHEIFYGLTDEQQEEYERLWEEYEAEKQEELEEGKELNKNLLEGAIYRQYLSTQMVPYTEQLADKFINGGEKVVIFCCFDDEIYKLKEYYGDKAVLFNGKCSLKQKDAAVESFMSDDNVKVFLGNIASAGVGITLISATKLIFSNFSFVPALNEQATDRIHRIGQTKDVDIYYQIFANTEYERMFDIVVRKTNIIDTVIKEEKDKAK